MRNGDEAMVPVVLDALHPDDYDDEVRSPLFL
jgi:hypothetical protein